jgi:hypothetical protein
MDGADGNSDVLFAEVFDDAGKGRCCGVVDVADGRAVEHYPLQSASWRDGATPGFLPLCPGFRP